VLTARDQVTERIATLNAGADDYLVKPFDLSEMNARINAVSRRRHGASEACVEFENIAVYFDSGTVNR
jgi:two-component system OmpR family response regulator